MNRIDFRRRPASASSIPYMLRLISFFLAFSCLWSFAGASIALAASPAASSAIIKPHPLSYFQLCAMLRNAPAPRLPAIQQKTSFRPTMMMAAQATPASHATRLPAGWTPPFSASMLDEVGRLAHPVAAAQVTAWKTELKTASPAPARAAMLHLWLGEWELAHNE